MRSTIHLIWVIAKSTYKELIRDRLLYGVLIVALLVTASSFFLATISLGQDPRVLENIGLASIHLFAVFISIFVTTNSLHHDLERRALYLIFPKPISRTQYMLGKYLGLVLILFTTLVMLGGTLIIGSAFLHREIVNHILINLGFSFLEISFLVALAELFVSFTAPINATLYTFAFFIIGHSLATLKEYVETFSVPHFVANLVKVCYYLLPNFQKFDVRSATLYQVAIKADQVGWALLYWLIYTSLVLFLAIQVMRKQEI